MWSNSVSDSMKFDEAVERNKIEIKLKPFPPKKKKLKKWRIKIICSCKISNYCLIMYIQFLKIKVH